MADPADDDPGANPAESSVIKDLRKKADRTDTAEARALAAERKLGLIEAGLGHLDEDQVNALVGSGEFDAAAAKAKAEKWGWTTQGDQPAPATDPAAAQEAATTEAELAQLANLSSGSQTVGPAQAEAVDLSQFHDQDSLREYMLSQIDENWGPTLPKS